MPNQVAAFVQPLIMVVTTYRAGFCKTVNGGPGISVCIREPEKTVSYKQVVAGTCSSAVQATAQIECSDSRGTVDQ